MTTPPTTPTPRCACGAAATHGRDTVTGVSVRCERCQNARKSAIKSDRARRWGSR